MNDDTLDLKDEGWQALNDHQVESLVRIDCDEDGEPVTRGQLTPAGYVDELAEELVDEPPCA